MFKTQYIYIILLTTSAAKHHKDNKKKKLSVLLFKICSLWRWQLFLPCKWHKELKISAFHSHYSTTSPDYLLANSGSPEERSGPMLLIGKKHWDNNWSVFSLKNHCAKLTMIQVTFLMPHNCATFLDLTHKNILAVSCTLCVYWN